MQWVFWLAAFFVVYVYAGYPLLLFVWARCTRPGARAASFADGEWPTVSIVLAARNEAARLPARLENLRALTYPGPRPQIIVVSDGSTDQTDWVMRGQSDDIEYVRVPPGGKALALNAGVARARGEVLVFADARQSFDEHALEQLVRPLADPAIGAVSGELILGCEPQTGRRRLRDRRLIQAALDTCNRRMSGRRRDEASSVGEGVRRYWQYEKELRRMESIVGSMLGATGAIYALRRSLWRNLPAGTILDDVLAPMRAVLAGARVVFEPAAHAYDRTAPDAAAESRRKVRTLAGNFQLLWLEPRLLVPGVNPVWLQYVSHKLGRLLVPYALVAMLVASGWLAPAHPVYALAFIAQLAFYLEAAYGWRLAHRAQTGRRTAVQRAGSIAFAFIVLNASAVAALGAAVLGRKVWR